MDKSKERIIGHYDDKEKGPLFICFGAMHGNEPAGVRAIELVIKMLEVEHIKNPGFKYKGQFVGLIGNLKAFKSNQRFLKKDLNRQFIKDHIEKIKQVSTEFLDPEDQELLDLLDIVNHLIETKRPEKIIFLDLHTTSSDGGIFTICKNDSNNIDVALGLHAPIVLGIIEGLKGTTLHYFTEENFGEGTLALTFESGQHKEPLAVNRAIAAIICTMREIGSVNEEDVENYHEDILISYSEFLPKLTTLVEHCPIVEGDGFKMAPGYKNFQAVKKNEQLAENNDGAILAKEDGLILMPLYQEKGEDGYFIVKEIKEH